MNAVEAGALPVLPEGLPPGLPGRQTVLLDDALHPVVHVAVDEHPDQPLGAGEHVVGAKPHDDAGTLGRHGPDGGKLLVFAAAQLQIGVMAGNAQPLGQPLADFFAAAAVLSSDGDDHAAPSLHVFLQVTV